MCSYSEIEGITKTDEHLAEGSTGGKQINNSNNNKKLNGKEPKNNSHTWKWWRRIKKKRKKKKNQVSGMRKGLKTNKKAK